MPLSTGKEKKKEKKRVGDKVKKIFDPDVQSSNLFLFDIRGWGYS